MYSSGSKLTAADMEHRNAPSFFERQRSEINIHIIYIELIKNVFYRILVNNKPLKRFDEYYIDFKTNFIF